MHSYLVFLCAAVKACIINFQDVIKKIIEKIDSKWMQIMRELKTWKFLAKALVLQSSYSLYDLGILVDDSLTKNI